MVEAYEELNQKAKENRSGCEGKAEPQLENKIHRKYQEILDSKDEELQRLAYFFPGASSQ